MARAVQENSLDEDNRRFVPDEVFETVDEAQETIEYLISRYEGHDGPLAYPVFTKQGKENIASEHVLKKCGFVPVFEGIGSYQGKLRQIFKGIWHTPEGQSVKG